MCTGKENICGRSDPTVVLYAFFFSPVNSFDFEVLFQEDMKVPLKSLLL